MTPPVPSAPAPPAPAVRGLLCLAAALVAGWLWHSWAVFGTSSWNDVRLAPAVALTRGEPLYPGSGGAPSTWMYGPLPLWLLAPAGWAPGPAAALGLAGLLNLLLPLSAIVAVCLRTPLPAGVPDRPDLRWAAVLLSVVLWPQATWQYLQADNTAIALGLLANLVLACRHGPRAAWLAALLATAPLLCKQTSVAVPVAQCLWLTAARGRRPAAGHLARLGASAAAWAVLALVAEDPAALRFALITLPGHLPWVSDLGERLAVTGPALLGHLLLPVLVTGWLHRHRRAGPLALPLLSWLVALPPGLAALLTYGGNVNSLQGLGLWLPAGCAIGVAVAASTLPAHRTQGAVAGFVLAVAALRLALAPAHPWGLNHDRYDRAREIATLWPGQVWFPWHPLVTLYTDGRRYADEDGLAVRALAGRPLTRAELAAHLPPDFAVIALPAGTAHWGVARELRPADARPLRIGEWSIDEWTSGPAKP